MKLDSQRKTNTISHLYVESNKQKKPTNKIGSEAWTEGAVRREGLGNWIKGGAGVKRK